MVAELMRDHIGFGHLPGRLVNDQAYNTKNAAAQGNMTAANAAAATSFLNVITFFSAEPLHVLKI